MKGESVKMRGGVIYIKEKKVKRERVGKIKNKDVKEEKRKVEVYSEKMKNGVKYEKMEIEKNQIGDEKRVFEVNEGNYLMMGENREK